MFTMRIEYDEFGSKLRGKTNKPMKVVSESTSLRDRQPFLSARWEKVAFFRKIFSQK